MAKKIRIYISGPITNDKEGYETKFKKAAEAINKKETLGFNLEEAISPIDLEPEYTSDTKWADKTWLECIKKDLDLLATCDAMVMLPGWDYSAGCITEYIAAKKLGIYIMTLHDIFGVESDDDRHKDEFPTFHARFIRDTIKEIKNLKSTEESWQVYKDKFKAAINDALKEERANDKGDFIIKFTNTEKYASESVQYLRYIDTDGLISWTEDIKYALHMGEHKVNRSLKILKLVKEKDKYEWDVEIIPYSSKYVLRYWDNKEHQWMYLEQSKCGYKIGMFNFNKDKAERFTLADANKEKVRIQCYDKKFGERLQVVDVTYNENGCLDCPPIEEDIETDTDRKYAVRYWDDKDNKWKYYRFGGGFGDKEGCQTYTYTDAKKVLAFSTARQKLEIADTTVEDLLFYADESDGLHNHLWIWDERDKLWFRYKLGTEELVNCFEKLNGSPLLETNIKLCKTIVSNELINKITTKIKTLVGKGVCSVVKKEVPDDFLVLSYKNDGPDRHYLSVFDKRNKNYAFSNKIDEAVVFPSRAKALKAYHTCKRSKKPGILSYDVLTVARKSDVLKWDDWTKSVGKKKEYTFYVPEDDLTEDEKDWYKDYVVVSPKNNWFKCDAHGTGFALKVKLVGDEKLGELVRVSQWTCRDNGNAIERIKKIENEGDDGNFVLAYFGPDNKLRYVKALGNKSCWTVERIKEAKHFTKVGAIQALEKILHVNMVNFKNVQIEPFIVNLSKMEEK